MPQRGWQA
ncbi:hypothetical protein D046_3322A, partial [Vibrio parahaemolyticus V-223/04]